MTQLTERQLELLQDFEKSGGAIDVRGNANFADYEQLEKAGYIKAQAVNLSLVSEIRYEGQAKVRQRMPWEDTLDHIRHIDIPAADLERWEAAGRRLETVAPEVLVEIAGLSPDPCKHRMLRVAKAALYAAEIADEPLKTEAVALAEELEQRSV